MDEVVAWAKRCPNPMSGPSEIEIWPFLEAADSAEFLTPEELSGRRRPAQGWPTGGAPQRRLRVRGSG